VVTQLEEQIEQIFESKNKPPLVRIVMATYNRADLLPRALDSVIKQTFTDWEMYIVNDASTDNTERVLSTYWYKDGRFTIVNRAANAGAVIARLPYMLNSPTKYLAILDDDDWWDPLYLEEQVTALLLNPRAPFSLTDCYKVFPEGTMKYSDPTKFIPFPNILPSLTFFDTERFRELEGWDTFYFPYPYHHVEADFWIRACLLSRKDPAHVKKPLLYYSFTPGSAGSDRTLDIKHLEILASKWKDLLTGDTQWANRKVYSQLEFVTGVSCMVGNRRHEAIGHIREALRWDISDYRVWGALIMALISRNLFIKVMKSYRERLGAI